MKELLLRLLDLVGVGAFYRRRNRYRLPILMYHGVVEQDLVPFCWHMLSLKRFRRQMRWVKRRFHVLPLTEALAHLKAGTLPPHSCAITFDDGFRNDRTVAFPVLERLGLHSTIFLVTGHVGGERALWPDRLYLAFARTTAQGVDLGSLGLGHVGLGGARARAEAYADAVRALKALPRDEKDDRMAEVLKALGQEEGGDPGDFRLMDWADVRALSESGLVSFAPHGARHDILSRVPDEDVPIEVRASHHELTRRLGAAPDVFAYPNGRAVDYDVRSKDAVKACGMKWALTTEEGLNDGMTDPLALKRVSVGADLSMPRFRLLVSGALSALRRR